MAHALVSVLDHANVMLRDMGERVGVEIVGSRDGPERIQRCSDLDACEIRIALPRLYGVGIVGSRQLLSTPPADIYHLLESVVLKARRHCYGAQLVESANAEFAIKRRPQEVELQRMERAALRLMTAVDRARKEPNR